MTAMIILVVGLALFATVYAGSALIKKPAQPVSVTNEADNAAAFAWLRSHRNYLGQPRAN
jgi:hypothetical protein